MNLIKPIVLLAACLAGIFPNAFSRQSPRETVNFNRAWKYRQGDRAGAERPDFDDKSWETVGLPHSFSIPYFQSKDFYTGYGWYRKHWTVSPEAGKKKLFLEFDGVFQEAEVFVNGKPVGTHTGGYTGFSVDITPAIRPGDNLIAVRVNNLWKPDVAPRAGEHVFSGGIYRNVRLVAKAPVHIDWYGTFVTTPGLEASGGKSAAVRIETDVCNRSAQDGRYRLITRILDPDGKTVAVTETSETVAAGSVKRFGQTTKPVRRPRLWHPSRPALYKAVSLLYNGKELIDSNETSFGFRWFEWTADRGFFLNGEHIYFKGANVHQDQAGWGDAVTDEAARRDVQMMKEAGFDFIRGSHYPHSPAFSRACDEAGMLFWSEAPFWGIGGFRPDGYWDSGAYPVREKDRPGFEASALQQLEEMIRIHRNHPSIVAWSMCNEAFFSAAETLPGVRGLLEKMVDLSRRLDPGRPAAVGGVQRPLGKNRIDRIGDIAGYNGDGSTLPDFQRPGIPSLVSEYGSTTADRPGAYGPGWGDLARNDAWKGLPWRSGQAIWCGFDHGSIAGSSLGKMGIVDYFRIPKRAWYWYRHAYAGIEPPEWPGDGAPAQIRLDASKTDGVRADGTDDVLLTVTMLDADGKETGRSPSVELKLLAGPGEFPTGTSIRFEPESDIRIADGKAAIAFRSYYAGEALVEASSPGLKPARVKISFVGAPRYESGLTGPVKERTYRRFVRGKDQEAVQTFGRNNPTFASSQQPEHTAGQAADGDKTTWWQAAPAEANPDWTLDTEKGLSLRRIRIVFPRAGVYRYKVETSADRSHWRTLLDNGANTESETVRTIDLTANKPEMRGRFVRIVFSGNQPALPAALAEVTVEGIVQE